MERRSTEHVKRSVAAIYNSAVAVPVISAAWELGALDELNNSGRLDADDFATRNGLEPRATLGMFRALAAVDVVERDGNAVTPGVNFAEVLHARSFFHWLARGNADLLQRIPDILRTANRVGDFYQRDSTAIAVACREMSTFCYDPWFQAALDGIDHEVGTVADLGCGSGERLFHMLRHFPGARAIGIDVAKGALSVAEEASMQAGLADRVTFHQADARNLEPHPDFSSVHVLTCFMMGHDLWPKDKCVRRLQNLLKVFPKAHTFLLGDATRTVGVADRDLPVFTLGFEFMHDMMGTFIPTVEDWESVFEDGGWQLRKKHDINLTVGETIFELKRL